VKTRIGALESIRTSRNKEVAHTWWTTMVNSPRFDLMVGALIFLNFLLLAAEVEYRGRALSADVPHVVCDGEDWTYCGARAFAAEDGLIVMEHVFTAAFATELLLRLSAEGLHYFHAWSNRLDAAIVVVGALDSWIFPFITGFTTGNTYLLRLLRFIRLARLVKVLRVFKAMEAFKSLRVLIGAVQASVGALFWSLTMLFIVDLAGAILMAQFCRPIIESEDEDPDLRYFLFMKFGTCWASFLTFFELTFVPGSLLQFREWYGRMSPFFTIVIMIFKLLVTFAGVRIIAALFLKATFSAHGEDDDDLASMIAQDREEFAKMLQKAQFDHASRGHGEMSRDDLMEILTIPQMRDWLLDVDLDIEETKWLFSSLDHQTTGRIAFSDFVSALMRMRGQPRSADVVVLLLSCEKVLQHVMKLERKLDLVDPEVEVCDYEDWNRSSTVLGWFGSSTDVGKQLLTAAS
jgi:hypothetical protein